MTAGERARRARLVTGELRRDYTVARWLVRTTLSRYAAVEPAAWLFGANQYGRPEIAGPAPGTGLHFNLSHTHDLAVCAVADLYEVGVDVEEITRRSETVAIADRFFSPTEVDALRRLPADCQRERFFHYWTLKEAYIKARGMGLELPLDQFSFHLDAPDTIRISFGAAIADVPSRWQFALLRPGPAHQLAVAVHRRDPMERSFALRDARGDTTER